jgi:hypothetical protein
MKARLTSFVLGLSMLFAVGAMPSKADAQVVVKVGPQRHYYHHHRYYHTYYRNGHAYRSYRQY